MPSPRSLVLLGALGLAALAARAEETPEARVAAAREGIAAIGSVAALAAKAEPEESEARSALDEFLAQKIEPPEAAPGLPVDALEQERLEAFDERATEL